VTTDLARRFPAVLSHRRERYAEQAASGNMSTAVITERVRVFMCHLLGVVEGCGPQAGARQTLDPLLVRADSYAHRPAAWGQRDRRPVVSQVVPSQ
jgi:hypothetical protein